MSILELEAPVISPIKLREGMAQRKSTVSHALPIAPPRANIEHTHEQSQMLTG